MVVSSNVSATIYDDCPECDFRVRFDDKPEMNQIVTCPECQTPLEVVSLSPFKLDWAFISLDDKRPNRKV